MLDAFIIDEIKRREDEVRDDAGRPQLEIPDPKDDPAPDEKRDSDDDPEPNDDKKDRGVVVIDM